MKTEKQIQPPRRQERQETQNLFVFLGALAVKCLWGLA